MRALRIGIDIGGTFTDAALVDGETGAIRVGRVLPPPEAPAQGFMAALERGLAEGRASGGDVAAVVHATTVATNAIIEGKIARVGMLVTRGFRDILEIGRQIRSRLYAVRLQKPAPLVERRFSLEVGERLDHEGRVLEPLDLDEVRAAARRLRRDGVEAVVVCLLHSYLNADHERAVADVVRAELPDAYLSVSSQVCPEYREYLRASTTAVNAAVMPIVSRYVDALESRLKALGAGRGGGYPVRTPVIDLVEVGAGGGSEAWIDAGGALRVGPRSAGARPGPACYGGGGTTPTITDANLVLGRLNPAFFLGGEMTLDAA